jgi:cell division transport system permease protein
MKTFFYNIGYFLLEAKRTIRFNPLSNFFSVIGTGLILFLLGLVLTGWSIGDRFIEALQKEAEISAYFDQGTSKEEALKLAKAMKGIEGVTDARYIDETEAQQRMKEMLGEESEILGLFDENPFEAFLEIRIRLDDMDRVLAEVSNQKGIAYVRDNRSVLEQMRGIASGLKVFGLLVMSAVGITTLIIISHMIRQGIYNNKDQINTLRLLGAPNGFIGFPFVLAGTLLTLLGGALAAALLVLLLKEGYSRLNGTIPFLPLPPYEELKNTVSMVILAVGAVLGLAGSLFGVSSIRKTDD